MKKNLLIVVILLLNCWTLLGQINKLPNPSKAYIQNVKSIENSEENYFTKYLGKKFEHILKRTGETKVACKKEFEFQTGIKMKTDSCSEVAIEVEIIFPNYPKLDVVKFVEWFFKNDYSAWNKSKTKYQPIEDGDAGCYIEIIELKGKIILKYNCGC